MTAKSLVNTNNGAIKVMNCRDNVVIPSKKVIAKAVTIDLQCIIPFAEASDIIQMTYLTHHHLYIQLIHNR